MATTERVTVTLPSDMIQNIDRLERNRSRFISEAVANELVRRRREAFAISLRSPHPETIAFVDPGLADWSAGMSSDDDGLIDPSAGRAIRWVDGQGWVEESS